MKVFVPHEMLEGQGSYLQTSGLMVPLNPASIKLRGVSLNEMPAGWRIEEAPTSERLAAEPV